MVSTVFAVLRTVFVTAIATPIVFMDEHGVFRSTLLNPYFLATILTILIAYKVRHTLLTIILSLACFYGLVFWLN
jgi:branched-subunit amino acid transport protein